MTLIRGEYFLKKKIVSFVMAYKAAQRGRKKFFHLLVTLLRSDQPRM